MTIPLLDLHAQHLTIAAALQEAVERVVASQRFILGPEVVACEEAIASYVGAQHGAGVSSGSDAIYLALRALGIGPGDEVVTTPYSFIATAESIVRTGARPVFADIDAEMLLAPDGVAKVVTPRTRAIVAVHLFGRCAAIDALRTAAPGLPIVEDAAQAIGASVAGKRAGALGEVGCFSFFPSKNLGCWGDGGMVTTSDASLVRSIEALREHGRDPEEKYLHNATGGNFRLDALQAAIVRAKLPFLDGWTRARQQNARHYAEFFSEYGDRIRLPPGPTSAAAREDVYNQYVIRLAPTQRERLRRGLAEAGIGSAVYYPHPLHLQPCLRHLGYKTGAFPQAEQACLESLALPVFPELGESRLAAVAERVIALLDR